MKHDAAGRPLGYQYGVQPHEVDPIWAQIRAVRISRNLSVQEVAAMANVASSTVSRGERGFHTWLDRTRRVAEALDIQILAFAPIYPPEEADDPGSIQGLHGLPRAA